MGQKVLLIDPDKTWLVKARNFLINQMYEVVIAGSGREAQLALYNEKFFVVFINYDIQNHSFTQVLKFIKFNHANQCVIAIVDNQEMVINESITEERLQKWDVSEMIVRPFDISYLKEVLERYQSLRDLMKSIPKQKGLSDEIEVLIDDSNFSTIKIDEFYSDQYVFFDIFIKLSPNKYLKILHAGDTFSNERINKYKNEKQVEFLFFHTADRRKFIEYNNFIAKTLIEDATVEGNKKASQLRNVTEKFIEEAYLTGIKPQLIQQGRDVCENVFRLVENQPDLHLILKTFQDYDHTTFSHSFLVALYATAIVKQFEWQSQGTIELTALASMLHDVGKTLLPKEFINLRPKNMTPEQFDIYKTHPELGVKVMENCRAINSSMKQIILQHHEAYNGTGFPNRLKGSKILTLANIVFLANEFVEMMMENKLSPTETLCRILTDKKNLARYNTILLEKFIHAFADPKKIRKEANVPDDARAASTKKEF